MTVPEGHYEEQLRTVFADRRWLVAYDVLVSAGFTAERIEGLGAASCMALGASRGTGELPEGLETFALDVSAPDVMGGIRASEAALDDLPPEAIAAVDRWDPDRSARVIRPLFSEGAPVAGRPTYGRRDPRWVALEDKTTCDALWDAVGIARAPYRIVPLEPDALARAGRALDRGAGVVWAGDNRSGWHGAATYLRWVRGPDDADEALAFLGAACDRVRVMPFLDGIPCSVHGIVFPDVTIALRPCEMLVYRRPDSARLKYAAAATYWDPPDADRTHMRDAAVRVGDHLRSALGYRGVFTIDGVMTADGFLPTELNPRFGAAIGVMTRGVPRLPMYLLHLALIEGEPLDWRPRALESLILDWADANRDSRAGVVVPKRIEGSRRERLVLTDGGFRPAAEGEPEHARLFAGPATGGTYLGATLVPEHTPIGPSPAPRLAAALAWADAQWDLGLGPLIPAPELRG